MIDRRPIISHLLTHLREVAAVALLCWLLLPAGNAAADDTTRVHYAPERATTNYAYICAAPDESIPLSPLVRDSIVSLAGFPNLIGDLNVVVRASHGWPGDLEFELIHDLSGQRVTLLDRPGVPAGEFGCATDDLDIRFDDDGTGGAAEEMCLASPPALAGSATPVDPLSVFEGMSINGNWTLRATDHAGGFEGTLDNWCLAIIYAGATVSATPASFTHMQAQNQVGPRQLTIANTGSEELEWQIHEAAPHAAREVTLTPTAARSHVPLEFALDDGSAEFNMGRGDGDGRFMWLNRYTPVGDTYPFYLDEVAVLFTGAVDAGDTVDIHIYREKMSDPENAPVHLASIWDAVVQHRDGTTFSVYPLDEPLLFADGAELLIGVINRSPDDGGSALPAALDTDSPSENAFWGAWATLSESNAPHIASATSWGTVADQTAISGSWLIRGYGHTPCADAADISWLPIVTPTSGTLAPGGEAVVELRIDTSGVPHGVHTAELCIGSNDPKQPELRVPITLYVGDDEGGTLPASYGNATHTYSSNWLGPQFAVDDGVVVVALGIPEPGETLKFAVDVTGSGYLAAWVDWPADGDFHAPDKVIGNGTAHSGLVGPGEHIFEVTVPANTAVGAPLAGRFRLYDADPAIETPSAGGIGGEVEDYLWTFSLPTAVQLQQGSAHAPAAILALSLVTLLLLTLTLRLLRRRV